MGNEQKYLFVPVEERDVEHGMVNAVNVVNVRIESRVGTFTRYVNKEDVMGIEDALAKCLALLSPRLRYGKPKEGEKAVLETNPVVLHEVHFDFTQDRLILDPPSEEKAEQSEWVQWKNDICKAGVAFSQLLQRMPK